VKRLMTTTTLIFTICAASAPAAAERPEPELTAEAEAMIAGAGSVTNKWWVNDHIMGIVVETSPGKGVTVFADKTGRYLLSGALVDTQTSENLAETSTRKHFPTPGPEDMYAEAEQTHWVRTGAEGRGEPIYIVADTQCGYCHQVAQAIAKHGIQREIRWILVGYLGPKSKNQAAAILDMEQEPASRALWAILTGQADGEPQEAHPEGARAASANEQWAERWRVNGTPVMLLPHNSSVQRIVGLPQSQVWEIIKR